MVGLLLPWVALEDAIVLTALDRSITWFSVVVIGAMVMAWRRGSGEGGSKATAGIPSNDLIQSYTLLAGE